MRLPEKLGERNTDAIPLFPVKLGHEKDGY